MRRSPRTQPSVKIHVRRSTRNSEIQSLSNKHKSHRKEKKRKKDRKIREEEIEKISENFIEQNEENYINQNEENFIDRNEDQSMENEPKQNDIASLENKNDSILDNFTDHQEIDTKESLITCKNVINEIETTEPSFTKEDKMSDHEYPEVYMEVGERVKLKRRKKHRISQNEDIDGTSQTDDRDFYNSKHKKKKHKHSEHGNKK